MVYAISDASVRVPALNAPRWHPSFTSDTTGYRGYRHTLGPRQILFNGNNFGMIFLDPSDEQVAFHTEESTDLSGGMVVVNRHAFTCSHESPNWFGADGARVFLFDGHGADKFGFDFVVSPHRLLPPVEAISGRIVELPVNSQASTQYAGTEFLIGGPSHRPPASHAPTLSPPTLTANAFCVGRIGRQANLVAVFSVAFFLFLDVSFSSFHGAIIA